MSEKQEKAKARVRNSFIDAILLKIDKKGREINTTAYKEIRAAIELQLKRLVELSQNEKKRWRTLKKFSKEELQDYLQSLD